MSLPRRPAVAVLALLAAVLSGRAFADAFVDSLADSLADSLTGAAERASGAANAQRGNDLAFATGHLAPASDCAFAASHVDPDGRARRASVSRVTRVMAASHPAGAASSPGLTGVVSHVRRVLQNYVDEEIFGAIDAAGVTPAPPSSDAEFLRRATLDLTGRIPDAATVTAFLADPAADKRSRMIDTLLASDAFVDRWAQFFDDVFRNTSNADSGQLFFAGRNALHAYFVEALRSKKPYDLIARELVAGAGLNTANGQANFAVRNIQQNGPAQDTYDNLGASVGSAFLGTNAIFCTSCHNGSGHLDSINLWGSTVRRQDFWGMSAFFAKTRIPRSGTQFPNYTYTVLDDPALPDYRLNTTTGNKTDRTSAYYTTVPAGMTQIAPAYLRTPTNPPGGAPQPGEGYRAAMGRILTADPQFARATVNTLWKEMFTLGIVEPADGFDLLRQDPANPPPGAWTIQPTHPNLLTRLADDFTGHGFDLRYILSVMAKSSAYQLSSFYPGTWNDASTALFARHFPRRLRAEELFDAITKATNVPASLTVSGATGPVAWAGQLPDVNEPGSSSIRNFLDTFMRGDRDSEPRSSQFSISQSLSLMNDSVVVIPRTRNSAAGSAVNKLIAANATPAVIVETLYVSTLSRRPSSDELAKGVALFSNLAAGQTKTTVAEDLQFTLLNKLDFIFNY
ncbi:MAG: DUF1549 and DUF1553 domain-containing protein [Thermoanaerobaculia bacterium]|nr:DUF1549 and DUF1553 domain-containing protein [Thermoanaerobaculia bacterium]